MKCRDSSDVFARLDDLQRKCLGNIAFSGAVCVCGLVIAGAMFATDSMLSAALMLLLAGVQAALFVSSWRDWRWTVRAITELTNAIDPDQQDHLA